VLTTAPFSHVNGTYQSKQGKGGIQARPRVFDMFQTTILFSLISLNVRLHGSPILCQSHPRRQRSPSPAWQNCMQWRRMGGDGRHAGWHAHPCAHMDMMPSHADTSLSMQEPASGRACSDILVSAQADCQGRWHIIPNFESLKDIPKSVHWMCMLHQVCS